MKQRSEFMLVFRYEPNQNFQPTEADLAEMHGAWGEFIAVEMANKCPILAMGGRVEVRSIQSV